jgi:hypothetical protein
VIKRVSGLLAAAMVVMGVAGAAKAPALSHPWTANVQIESEDFWHADPVIAFGWQPQPPPGQPAVAAYRIRNSEGTVVQTLMRNLDQLLKPIEVPAAPGIYTLEMWLQNEAGEQGAHSSATVGFDDEAPPEPAVLAPTGWVQGTDAATVELGPGPGSLPLSGIRGYAISVDRGEGSPPCAKPGRCTAAELDLTGEAGSVSLGILPEGVNFLRAVTVSGSGVASGMETAEVRVDGTPPAVSLRGAPAGWSNGPVTLKVEARDALSGTAAAGPLGPYTAVAVDGGAPARAPGDAVSTTVGGSGIHGVEYIARDAAGNVADGSAGAPVARTTVRIDEEPPAIAFAASQDPAEPERIEALVRDSLSGPSSDRGWIAVRLAGSRRRFEQLPTRAIGSRLIARWDSDSYPQGKYEFSATGFDLAGNVGSGDSRTHGGRMVLVSPLKIATFLGSGFIGRRGAARGARRAPYGRGVQYGGRLRTAAGTSAAGVEVAITETFAAGSEPARRTSIVRTRADGSFSTRLAPGPSREVSAGFPGNRVLSRSLSEGVRLEVPSWVRLLASPATARVGGAPVIFSGKVGGAGARSVVGLPVELQFRFRGGKWSEFRSVETDSRGRFRYAYRFSDDDSRGVRFQFRAYVKGREGWPYGPGSSRPVLVTGR